MQSLEDALQMADELCLKNRIRVLPAPKDDLDLEENNDSSPSPMMMTTAEGDFNKS